MKTSNTTKPQPTAPKPVVLDPDQLDQVRPRR